MCSMSSVLCPLCAQTSFSSIDALRCSLIKAANGPLACPICHEFFLGLDKLTIHLFSHTNIMSSVNNATKATTTTTTASTTDDAHDDDGDDNNNDDDQNFKNHNENLKTHQTENINNINNNCSNNCTETKITQTQFVDEKVIFENSQPLHWEKNMPMKAKEPVNRDKANINKSNSTQQQQQVVTTLERDQEEPRELENLAQCDICEFTFRNEELRNMHIRLVHQNFEYHSNLSSPNKNIATSASPTSANDCHNASLEHDFKCHLCAKTFKTKGSLRVHLKVVHLMGLPYANNTPKLTICDRIRHKENKMLKSANPNHNNNTQLQAETTINTTPAPAEPKSSNSCNLFNITPVNFMSTLSTIPAAANISVVNLNQPLDFQANHLNGSALPTSNVLLVFNSSAAEMDPSLNALHNSVTTTHATADVLTIAPKDNDAAQKFVASMTSVTENPKIWECDVCSKAFTTKYFLKKHKRLHTGEMPYTCELCARTFTFQQSYHKHLLYHSDEKPHVCSTCGRAFKELSTLHNHERIHSGEKPFKCEICDKSFRQRVSFLVHTRIHTGVMPYKCEICQRSFRYKVSQRTHKCLPLSTEEPTPAQDEEGNTVDKMSENFIKAFLETSTTTTNQADQYINQAQSSPASNEIAAINEKETLLNEQQALLTKTIDDIVVESCNKMGIGSDGFAAEQTLNEGSMSPSQKLQNMRLYSPQLMTPDLNGIEGDLTRFFLDNSQIGGNML